MEALFHFFDLHQFVPSDLLVIATLIILECLLSCDNAVALAMVVRTLPAEQQGKALRYGIIGAYVFLFIALLAASWIVGLWYIKLVGGLYLVWMAVSHFMAKPSGDGLPHEKSSGVWRLPGVSLFWSAVITVELTDIAFSVDSVAAAIAFSPKFFVLLIAGMVYVLAMRFAAQGFIKLLKIFPRLETAAFIAVLIVGLKLCLELPGDVIGLTTPSPDLPPATTAVQYRELADARVHEQQLFSIPYAVTVTKAGLAKPATAAFATTRDFHEAQAHWNLNGRPLVHLEPVATAVLIMLVFAYGFRRPRADATVES